jgi:Heterokaryon incompatibility protein (HET)
MNPMLLTAGSETSFRAGISTDFLPKTFRDAISIANRFSIHYLWIDSMCIFQDDLSDWHKEAAVMCDVYSNALCNIAATGASDVSTGLFFERDPAGECAFWVNTNWRLFESRTEGLVYPAGVYGIFLCDQWTNDLELGPLNSRAWVMQERFLSTRVLHFSTSQVFWECLENTSSEVFPDAIPQFAKPLWFLDSQSLKRIFIKTQRRDEWGDDLYKEWEVFVRAYSRCALSEESDKLVAINGIGQLISKITGDRLIGGLWHDRLIQGLCWSRDSTAGRNDAMFRAFYPQKWRAPTWSWASTNVEMHPSNMRHHLHCPSLQNKVTIAAIDSGAFSSGQLKHASLKLRGKLLYATFAMRGPPFRLDHVNEIICGTSSITQDLHREHSFKLILDNPNAQLHYRGDLICLGMFACRRTEDSDDDHPTRYLEALALRPRDAGKGQYERVGIVEIRDSSYDFYTANETDAEFCLEIL